MTRERSLLKHFLKADGLSLCHAVQTERGWVVKGTSRHKRARCPVCHTLSRFRHSRYWRSMRDLPQQGTPVLLRLELSRWRYRNAACPQRLFTKPLRELCARYARQTRCFDQSSGAIAHALGGRPGQRLTCRLGLPSSTDTPLRQLKMAARRAVTTDPPVRVVGVDDWAWRKGHHSFGTILVDLERGAVVDLLPVRSAEALAEWLWRHPEVTVVSRDRQGCYEGARGGAPKAQQVADRCHLVLNLTQAVEGAPALQHRFLRTALAPSPSPSLSVPPPPVVTPSGQQLRRPRRCKVRTYDRAILRREQERARLRRQQKLELSRPWLDRWARLDVLPQRSRMVPRPDMPEAFRVYLRQRWQAGCQHGPTPLAVVPARGYRGCYSGLAKLLSPGRQQQADNAPDGLAPAPVCEEIADVFDAPTTDPEASARQISPQRAAALLSKPQAELTAAQAEIVDTLKERCPGYALMRRLVMSFRTLLRPGRPATLHRWMERARASGIATLVGFVQTLKEDLRAVEAAVSSRRSNGPVEVQSNRLKTLKRQMYGRAGVELLRARLRAEPVFSPP